MLNVIGLTVAFVLVVFLVRKWGEYGLSMILGAIIVALFSYQYLPTREIPAVFWKAVASEDTIALTISIVLIGVLANAMKETGEINGLINGLEAKAPAEGRLILFPAIFGLLPILGGALMSAPYIEEGGEKIIVEQHTKTFLNLWFRHIVFIIYPLSPALIFISEKALGGEIHQIIFIQTPAFLLSLLVGVVPLLKIGRINLGRANQEKKEEHTYTQIFVNFIPILVTILLFISLTYFFHVSSFVSFAASVPLGIAISFLLAKTPERKVEEIVRNGFSMRHALAVVGVMVFYKTIQSSGLCDVLGSYVQQSKLPISFLIVAVSFSTGFALGENFAAAVLSYAILEPIVGVKPPLPMASLIHISTLIGHLISPVHLCVVLSYEYFKPDFGKFYKLYILSALLILVIWTLVMTILLD